MSENGKEGSCHHEITCSAKEAITIRKPVDTLNAENYIKQIYLINPLIYNIIVCLVLGITTAYMIKKRLQRELHEIW